MFIDILLGAFNKTLVLLEVGIQNIKALVVRE
jgi:hypothetical protein